MKMCGHLWEEPKEAATHNIDYRRKAHRFGELFCNIS